MCVIVRNTLRRIKLINRQPAGLTGEEFGDDSCINRDNRCPSRREDIRSFMPALSAISGLSERVLNIRGFKADDRKPQSATGERS